MKDYRWVFACLVAAALLGSGLLLSSCGGGGGDDDDGDDDVSDDDTGDDDTGDDDSDFFPPAPGTSGMYRLCYDEAETQCFDLPAEVIGQDSETFSETYTKMTLGDFSKADPTGLIMWFDLSTFDRVGYKAAEIYFGGISLPGSKDRKAQWDMKEVYDEPLYILFDGDIGETKTSTADGDYIFPDASTEEHTTTIEATLTSRDATITVPYGEVSGCVLVEATLTETDQYGTWDVDVNFWFHPDFGFVRADIMPGFWSCSLISFEGK